MAGLEVGEARDGTVDAGGVVGSAGQAGQASADLARRDSGWRTARFHAVTDGRVVALGRVDRIRDAVDYQLDALEPLDARWARGVKDARLSGMATPRGGDRTGGADEGVASAPAEGGNLAGVPCEAIDALLDGARQEADAPQVSRMPLDARRGHRAPTACLGTVDGQPDRWWPCAVCTSCLTYLGPWETAPDASAWLASGGHRREPFPGAATFLRTEARAYAAWVGHAGMLALRRWREEAEALLAEERSRGDGACRWCGAEWGDTPWGDVGPGRVARHATLDRHDARCPWRQLREAEGTGAQA